jgi:hypothetical protein
MFLSKPARLLAIATSLTTLTVYAQTSAPPPGAVSSSASPISYQSALESYQPYRDEKIRPWKESNDTVGKIGGWRAYAKEAAEPANPSGVPAPGASGAPNPHAGHGKQ